MDADTRERIQSLCDQLSKWPSIRDQIGTLDLDTLRGLLNSPAAPDEARIVELLDAVEQAGARAGLPGLTSGIRSGAIPGLPDGFKPSIVGWTCPVKRCARVVLAGNGVGVPICGATSAEMAPYRASL